MFNCLVPTELFKMNLLIQLNCTQQRSKLISVEYFTGAVSVIKMLFMRNVYYAVDNKYYKNIFVSRYAVRICGSTDEYETNK